MCGVFAAFGKEVRKRGRAEGRAEGIAEGRAEGIAIGGEQTKRAVVRSMLANGCSHEDIARPTSLPLAEVRALAGRQGGAGGRS